jgi:hypothetical protein
LAGQGAGGILLTVSCTRDVRRSGVRMCVEGDAGVVRVRGSTYMHRKRYSAFSGGKQFCEFVNLVLDGTGGLGEGCIARKGSGEYVEYNSISWR